MTGVGLPSAPPQTPGFPSNPLPIKFEEFATLNTKALRAGIKNEEMSWCDGWMPLGPSNLRTLYGVGTALYTATGGKRVILFGFGNAGKTPTQQHAGTPISIVFLDDGSCYQVNVDTNVVTTIAAPGTFTTTQIGLGQFGNQYIIIVANQTNGYFLWDTTSLYSAGSLAPVITVTNGGSGYSATPTITFTGGSGSGATATAIVLNGIITSIALSNPGTGWTAGQTVTVVITDSTGSGATATVGLMPFGIQGTAVETYVSRVWVANQDTGIFTAPGSVSDFSSSGGGGTFVSNDSFLRVKYVRFLQTNGYLYLIADSSINYISGVNTSGSPPVTTFSNQNVDPQIGTPYPLSVQVFSRNILLANSLGIHVSYGGAVTKVSQPLDGVYNTVPNFGGLALSGAVANIFGVPVYMTLATIIDPYTGQQVNKLLMWDGKKWWTSPQDVSLIQIASQEINSVLTAWGTDGTSIYPMFQQGTTGFTKVVQSKLFSEPGYYYLKNGGTLFGLVNYFSPIGSLIFDIDSEMNTARSQAIVTPNTISWTNNVGNPITWTNNLGNPIVWLRNNFVWFSARFGQFGKLLGMTARTTAPDVGLISATMVIQNYQTLL